MVGITDVPAHPEDYRICFGVVPALVVPCSGSATPLNEKGALEDVQKNMERSSVTFTVPVHWRAPEWQRVSSCSRTVKWAFDADEERGCCCSPPNTKGLADAHSGKSN